MKDNTFKKYLNENIKMKDFDNLVKDELNDKQIQMLFMMVNSLGEYFRSLKQYTNNKDYKNAIETLFQLYARIESGIKVMNQRAD